EGVVPGELGKLVAVGVAACSFSHRNFLCVQDRRPGAWRRAAPRPGVTALCLQTSWSRIDVEADALCQGQARAVVHRVGGAAHIGLPRIRAGLATAAGLLLAAERAADLGTGRADI